MGKKLIFDYTFDASARTITLKDVYAEKRFLLITNVTDGVIIYQFNDANLGLQNIAFDYDNSETTLTLNFDTENMSDDDELQILLEEESTDVTINDRFVDPVSKIRVSNPENLIDTDFEYGLQSTKWETLELTNNIPTFFSRSGDFSLPLTSIDVQADSDIVTVVTEIAHSFQRGTPIIMQGTGSVSADGGFVVSSVIDDTTFNYKAKTTFLQTRSILEEFTQLFPGSVYAGTEFKLTSIGGITTDGAAESTLTVNTEYPTDFENGTSMALSNSFAKATVSFDTDDVIVDNTSSINISYTSATATGEDENFFLGGVNGITWLPQEKSWLKSAYYFEEGTLTVNTSANSITTPTPHGFQLYDNVMYVCDESTNTAIGGLDANHCYTVVPVSDTEFYLSNTRSNASFYRRSLTANGVSGGVVKSAFVPAYFHSRYYSSDYGLLYLNSTNDYLYNTIGLDQTDNPVFYTDFGNYSPNSEWSTTIVETPFDPGIDQNFYDYYVRARYNSSFSFYRNWYWAYISTFQRKFVSNNNYQPMGVVPAIFGANKSSLWVPNHGITEPTIVELIVTAGTAPGNLPAGSYIAERVNDNRLSFKTLSNSDIVFSNNGDRDFAYRIEATIPDPDGNTIEIAGNTLIEGDAIVYYNDADKDDSGTDIGGLSDGTTYYAALKTGDKFKLSTASNVYGDVGTCLAQSSFTWVNLTANTMLLDGSNPFTNGDAVQYAAITPVLPLKNGGIYYVRGTSGNNIALYYTSADAVADTNRVDLLAYGSGRGNFTKLNIVDLTSTPATAETQVFEADFVGAADGNYTVASTGSDGLSFDFETGSEIQARSKQVVAQTALAIPLNALYIPDHGFITGDSVTVTLAGTTNLSGLTSGNTYYMIRSNKDFVKFASSEDNALSGTAISLSESGSSSAELTGTITMDPSTIVGSFNGNGTVSFVGSSKTITGLETSFTSYFNKGDSFFINIPETTETTAITGVNGSIDVFTAAGHGITTGDMIRFSGDAAPANINFSNVYFARAVSNDTFSVHYTETDANANTNLIQLSTIGTNANVIDITTVGDIHEADIDFVNSETQITTVDDLPSTGQDEVNYLLTTSLLLRPDGFALHRPYDGGVELIPPTNPDSQMIRQTRKYFRYQSGKGIQVSFAVNFSPTSQTDSFTRTGDVGTIVTRFPHRLSAGLFVTTTGSTNAKDTIGTKILNVSVAPSTEDAAQNKFYLDGSYSSTYSLLEGRTYRFDLTDSTNDGHPFTFSTTEDGIHEGGTEYSTGVTYYIDGSSVNYATYLSDFDTATTRYLEITVATDAPTLYTYCQQHPGMGFTVPTVVDSDNNLGNLWNGSHEVLSVVDDFTFTVQLDGTPSDNNAFGVIEYYVNNWENSALRCGLFDDQNGIFFEYDGQELYCCRRSSIRQISGYANLEFRSSEVRGIDTKFLSQLSVGDYVVIKGQSHRVSRIDGNELMYIVPSYRGVNAEKVIITKTETTRVTQDSWSLDTCDGTGYTGFKLDIHKIQMAYIDYSWYGAGKVRFGFKDQHGNVRYVHSFVHGNFFTEAYMRSGNVPARYEIQNIGAPTYVPALAHWGTSVIMDGRFDPDKAYIFNASSQSLTLTGLSQLSVQAKVDFAGDYYILNRNFRWRRIGKAIELDDADPSLSSVVDGTVVSGANLPANTKASNPASTDVQPYRPYLPSITSYEGQSFNTGSTRNLLVVDSTPTGTSGSSSTYTIGEASGGDINVTKELPLISVRLAPSVDTSAPGFLGEREIINRMQLILNSVGILTTHACNVRLVLNGQLSSNAWERVTNPSLSQVIYHVNTDTIAGGQSVYNFEAQGGSGTARQPVLTSDNLGEIATLGNSILGGDNVFPDGPDVLTLVVQLTEDPSTVTSDQPFQVSGRVSWSESQA